MKLRCIKSRFWTENSLKMALFQSITFFQPFFNAMQPRFEQYQMIKMGILQNPEPWLANGKKLSTSAETVLP